MATTVCTTCNGTGKGGLMAACSFCGGIGEIAAPRASRSAPSPEPRSAGPGCDSEPEHQASKTAPLPVGFLLSSWPLDTVLERLADAADHLRGAHNCDAEGHEGVLYAAQAAREHVKALRAAPRAAGGTTATDPEALVSALFKVSAAYGARKATAGEVDDARAALITYVRTIATERDEARETVKHRCEQRDEQEARAAAAEARVSELTRERDEANARFVDAERDWKRTLRERDAALARVSELEAALRPFVAAVLDGERIEEDYGDEDRYATPFGTITGADVKAAVRALASRPPAATEGEGGTP
jgi:hypothetical protein